MLEQLMRLALHCWTCLKPETVEPMARTAGLGGTATVGARSNEGTFIMAILLKARE